MAGHLGVSKSVSPMCVDDPEGHLGYSEGDSGAEQADDEHEDGQPQGLKGERVRAERERDFVRKLGDPRLPSEDEVEAHKLRGYP